jgi:hypothetical protein
VKNIGKPCAGEPHARFDEEGQATPAPYSTLIHKIYALLFHDSSPFLSFAILYNMYIILIVDIYIGAQIRYIQR